VAQLYVYLADTNNNGAGSGSVSVTPGSSSGKVTIRTSCFLTGPLHVSSITVYDSTSAKYGTYDVQPSVSTTRMRVYQSGPGISSPTYELSNVPIASATTSAGSCTFPTMPSAPVFTDATVTGGVKETVTVPTSGSVGQVNVSFYETSTGVYLGSGSAPSVSGTATVQVSTSCIGSGTQVYARVTLYDPTSTYWRTYVLNTGTSATNYSTYASDGVANGPMVPTALALSKAGWSKPATPTCLVQMSSAPGLSANPLTRGNPETVTVSLASAASTVNVYLYTRPGNGYLTSGGASGSTGTATVTCSTSSSAATGSYYPAVYVYPPSGNPGYAYYSLTSLSSTNYTAYFYDGFTSQSVVSSIVVPTLTLQ
jgi:hypothetical protein